MSTSGLPSIGQALSASLQAVIDAPRRLDELSTARVVGEAADAVHKAQKGGQPLGTISPAAITLSSTGIKLETGGAASVGYTAPEKLKGSAGDRRSDVFSLGVVLWEALAHARLFDGATDEARKQAVLTGTIQPPSELNANVPAELDAICKKALARDPADRYQSAKVMAAEISAVLDDAGYPDSNEEIAKYLEKAFPPGASAGAALAAKLAATPVGSAATPRSNPNATTLGLAPIKEPARTKQPTNQPVRETFPGVGDAPHLTPADAPPTNKTAMLGSLPAEPRAKTPSSAPLSPNAFSKPASTLPPPNAIVSPAPAKPAATIVDTIPPVNAKPAATIVDTVPPATAPAKLDPGKTAILGSLSDPPKPVEVAKPVEAAKPAAKPAEPSKPLVAAKAEPVKPASIATAETIGTPALTPAAAVPTAVASSGSGVVGLPSMPPGASLPAAADDDFTAHEGKPAEPTLLPDPPILPATATATRAPTADPIAAVSLPRRAKTDSGGGAVRDVVDGWAWKSDAHPAILDDGGYHDDDEQQTSRKRLLIAIGGAVGAIALIAIIAMLAAGGDDKKKKEPDQKTDVAASDTGASRTAPDPEPTPAPAVEPAAVEPAAVEPPPTAPPTEPVMTPPPVEPAKVEPAKVEPAKVEPAKVVAPKVEPVKTAIKTEPAKVVAPKVVAPKVDPKKNPKVAKTTSAKPIDPYAAPDKPKVDPAAAYKTGFQQYVRGDTAGALATFKGSLASNPSFAPTWRGLGLVYEKMGQKADAKRSFRRYLQLSPGANDAEQIKDRMGRL